MWTGVRRQRPRFWESYFLPDLHTGETSALSVRLCTEFLRGKRDQALKCLYKITMTKSPRRSSTDFLDSPSEIVTGITPNSSAIFGSMMLPLRTSWEVPRPYPPSQSAVVRKAYLVG